VQRAIVKVLQSVCDEGRKRTRMWASEPFIMSDHRSLRRVIETATERTYAKYVS